MIKRLPGRWSLYERIWLGLFCTAAAGITMAAGDSFFGFAVFLSGALCVVLVAKGSILNYPVGVFNTLGYAWLAWQNGLYGETGLNLLFYFPMNIVGFLMWKKHIHSGVVAMRGLPGKAVRALWAVCAAAIALLGLGLGSLEGQNTPYVDAATNVLSVAATLLTLLRFREQWTVYIALNALSVLLWSMRGLAGSSEAPLMIVMWSAYLANAFYGWYNWSGGAARTGEAAQNYLHDCAASGGGMRGNCEKDGFDTGQVRPIAQGARISDRNHVGGDGRGNRGDLRHAGNHCAAFGAGRVDSQALPRGDGH